jgi:glyoxalase family protein
MPVRGLHHVTAITADAPANVGFYARVLGLRMIKKTVNFDAPDVYHLYFGDETGTPGTVLTFFEFPGVERGQAGAGMVHRIDWRVVDEGAQAFWERRLADAGVATRHADGALVSAAEDGLVAQAPEIPPEHALRGFAGVRAFASAPGASAPVLADALELTPDPVGGAEPAPAGAEPAPGGGASPGADAAAWRTQGERPATLAYDPAPVGRGRQGAGSVHHVAWRVDDDDHLRAVRSRVGRAGARPTEVIDRQYFHSVYFREPSGVLFELATAGPGFAIDEPPEALGERLSLPPQYEHLREQLERRLTPLTNPRSARAGA